LRSTLHRTKQAKIAKRTKDIFTILSDSRERRKQEQLRQLEDRRRESRDRSFTARENQLHRMSEEENDMREIKETVSKLARTLRLASNVGEIPVYRGRYDKRSFDEFIELFNKGANFNGWTPEDCCLKLPMYLVEAAAEVYNTLINTEKTVWKTLVDTLAKKFKIPENVERQRYALEHRMQGARESVEEYASAIQKLIRKSYPTSKFTYSNMISILAVDNFVKGLRPELKAQVKRECKGDNLKSIEDAIEIAENEENIQLSLFPYASRDDAQLQETLATARDLNKKVNALTDSVDSLKIVSSTAQEEDSWYRCRMSNGETRGNGRPNGEARGNGRPNGETRGISDSGNDFQQNQLCHNGCGKEEIAEVNEIENEYYDDGDGNEYYDDEGENECYDYNYETEYLVDEDGNEYYYDGDEYEEEVPGPSYL
jgi:hypothetical protein